MHKRGKLRKRGSGAVAFLLVTGLLLTAGCFGPKEPPHYLDEGEKHLVRLDRVSGPAQYDHPAEVDLEKLKSALASVVARHEVSLLNRLFTQQKEIRGAAFTPEEIDLLADRMKIAFSKATPQEQVAFFLTSRKNSLSTLITSGVAFIQGGELHLILANDQTAVSGEQRAYIPRENPLLSYEPGSFELLPQAHQQKIADASGPRMQGMIISLTTPLAPAAAEPVVSKEVKPPLPSSESPLEEKFRLLKKLREENLITEEEYKEKKSELLKSIEVK